MTRSCDEHHLVLEERHPHEVLGELLRLGSDRDVSGARADERTELSGRDDGQLDLEIGGSTGEELDQTRGGVLGEQARRGQPQQPAAVAGLAHLAHGLIRQTQQLDAPAGESQPARGERQTRARSGEERVVELLAQLRDVP